MWKITNILCANEQIDFFLFFIRRVLCTKYSPFRWFLIYCFVVFLLTSEFLILILWNNMTKTLFVFSFFFWFLDTRLNWTNFKIVCYLFLWNIMHLCLGWIITFLGLCFIGILWFYQCQKAWCRNCWLPSLVHIITNILKDDCRPINITWLLRLQTYLCSIIHWIMKTVFI